MKKTKLRELSPVIISVFILSLSIIGLASAAITNNGSIGGLFFKFVGESGYDYNLQTTTVGGYKLDGRNIHTDFGGQNLTTTGNVNAGAGVFTKKVTSDPTIVLDAANTLTTKGYIESFATTAANNAKDNLGDHIATQSLNMSGSDIINIKSVFATSNISTNGGIINNLAFKSGPLASDGIFVMGPINANGQKINNLGNPIALTDAVNKAYVDNKLNNTISCPTGKYLESFNLKTNLKNCVTLPAGGVPYTPYALTKKYLTPGTFNWTVPAGPTSIKIIGVGGGGGGGSGWPGAGGGGGGGASASAGVFPVVQGQVIKVYVGAKGAGSTGYNWCTIGYNGANTSVTISGVNYILGKGGQGGSGWTAPCGVTGKGGAKIPASGKITETFSSGSNSVGTIGGKSSLDTLSHLGIPSSYFTYGKGGNSAKGAGNNGIVIIKY